MKEFVLQDDIYDEINNYNIMKIVELILTDNFIDEIIDVNPELCTFDFLVMFEDIIEQFISREILSPIMKKNALSYLNHVRFVIDGGIEDEEDRNFIINLINKLIVKLNDQRGKNYIEFYRNEMYKRTNNKKFLRCPDTYIKQCEQNLFESISLEQMLLYSHSVDVSDEEFQNECLPDLSNDPVYFDAISCFINECPHLFLDKLFYSRFLIVMNEWINKEKGNRSIKKFQRRINHTLRGKLK